MKIFWIKAEGKTMAFNPAEIALVNGGEREFTIHLTSGKQIHYSGGVGVALEKFIETWEASLNDRNVHE